MQDCMCPENGRLDANFVVISGINNRNVGIT